MIQTAESPDQLARAKQQGQAQYDHIRALVAALNKAATHAQDENETTRWLAADAYDTASRAIREDALSVIVRSDWYVPIDLAADRPPREYEILLRTDGPAMRITGQLDEDCEPVTAAIEIQDWYEAWTAFRPAGSTESDPIEETLLAYAQCFYFGGKE